MGYVGVMFISYHRRDSNPHLSDPKSDAATRLGYGGLKKSRENLKATSTVSISLTFVPTAGFEPALNVR